MKLVTVEQMKSLEQRSDAAGHDYATMMERAGHAVASVVRDHAPAGAAVLVLVGPGNNGGDGLVAARYLHSWGFRTEVYIWRRDDDVEDPNLDIVQELEIPLARAEGDAEYERLAEGVQRCDVVIDALLGTGVTGPLRGGLPELLGVVHHKVRARRRLAAAPAPVRNPAAPPAGERACPERSRRGLPRPLVVAVDVPSGLASDSGAIDERALPADLTVTFAYPKRGQYAFPGAEYVGELLVADIGIDPALARDLPDEVADAADVAALLPERPASSHKGTYGRALIVAGSTNYVGAACLAAQAAYRAGAGLVTLAVPEAIHPIVAAKVTEPTFLVLPHDMGVLAPRLGEYEALLVGPGLGRELKTRELVAELVAGKGVQRRAIGFAPAPRRLDSDSDEERPPSLPPMVVDADALNLLAEIDGWWEGLAGPAILTPHRGEMARLTRLGIDAIQRDRMGVARDAARRWGQVVVLKGAYTVVAAPEGGVTVIPYANAALATAGTGDVLAGAIVAFLAQGLAPRDAAVCGAYLHGLAGELWSRRTARAGMLAGDLLPLLPQALEALT
jgi:NAD(P)H-hydrate epimerase